MIVTDTMLLEVLRDAVLPLAGVPADDDPLMELIGDARVVLLGEASHGTHEFYAARAALTRRLIAEKGFTAVAVEADWPDAYRANCYVQGAGHDTSADDALSGLKRFPAWMWRNTVVCAFIDWLRAHNQAHPPEARPAGFYGLDLYSLYGSIEAVIGYLDRVDPEAAARARERYACFEHYHQDSQEYGAATSAGLAESCEDAVVAQLVDLQRRGQEYANRDGRMAEDEYFYAEQNARLARNAEEYYRAMFRGRVSSWNLRDRHMAATLDALIAPLDRDGGRGKVVVWAHNSHLGDARATEMGARRVQRRPARARALRRRGGERRLHDRHGDGHGGVRLGRDRRAQARAPGSGRELRGAVSCGGAAPLPAAAARGERGYRGAARRAAGAGHRRHLSARDRALEPLL